MKPTIFCCLALLLATSAAFAQPNPLTTWVQFYGDSCYGYWDDPWSVFPTTDGGYIFGGETQRPHFPTIQMWLVRTDSTGNQLWENTYGFQTSGNHLIRAHNGDYIINGYAEPGVIPMMALLRVDSAGNQVWLQHYDSTDGSSYETLETPDGGFVLAGVDRHGVDNTLDACLLRTDSAGNLLWMRRYDAGGQEIALALQRTIARGYVLVGYRTPMGSAHKELFVVCTDSLGDTLWQRLYDQTYQQTPGAGATRILDDGSILICGTQTDPGSSNSDAFLTKLTPNGDVIWRRVIGRADSIESGVTITIVSDGYLIGGTTRSFTRSYSFAYLAKTDLNGNTLWHCGFHLRDTAQIESIIQLADRSLILCGISSCILGPTEYPPDGFLLRTGPDGVPVGERPDLMPHEFGLSAYPNPFNPSTEITFMVPQTSRVELAIFDLQGRLVETLADQTYDAGEHRVRFDGSARASGVYFARLTSARQIMTTKLLLLK